MPLPWLILLSDPEGLKLSAPPQAITRAALDKILDVAESHGVLPATVANLSAAQAKGRAELVAIDGKEDIESVIASKKGRLRAGMVLSLMLRHQGDNLMKALSVKSIPAFILKGAHFAGRLYNPPSLRTFTDVDIMVPRNAVADVSTVLEGLGYRRTMGGRMKHASDYGQEAWEPDGWPGGLVEIHWDLVNSARLRRNISCSFYDLQFEKTSEPSQSVPSPACLLLIASVHAATSHSFDRLLQLYDIRQICLGKAGRLDTAYLSEILVPSGCRASVMVGLNLCGRVLKSEECLDLAARLKLNMPMPLKAIITPSMLQREPDKIDSLRRKILREVLKRI
ncbi:MAG: nucleotidyltransferase family protein [Syntrophobacteraceae bacterium]